MTVDSFHDFNTASFGGVTCAQYWVDFMVWEAVLNTNPELKSIIEIGTWQGGFSRYLWAQAELRGMFFATYDSIQPDVEPPCFQRLDVYRFPELVAAGAPDGPLALFCDGGNKPRELKTFPQLMPEGSIILVHDWGTETVRADVPDTLEELYGDYCDEVGSITRIFRVKA